MFCPIIIGIAAPYVIAPVVVSDCKIPTEAPDDWIIAVIIRPVSSPSTGFWNIVNMARKDSLSLSTETEFDIDSIPTIRTVNPRRIAPMSFFLLFFENIFRKSPIMARIGIHEDGFSQFIMDEAAFPPSRLERPMSHDVSAAPRFEPIMTPIDCRSVIVPELTNPTTITVVAEDDCTIAVTTSPSRKPLN